MLVTLIPTLSGAAAGAGFTWIVAAARDGRAEAQGRKAFGQGLLAELDRCIQLDLKAPYDEILNRLVFPHIVALAASGQHAVDLPPNAYRFVCQVYYCVDRFHRWIDVEAPLLRERYSPNVGDQQRAEEHLRNVHNAAVAELERSLKCYANMAIQPVNEWIQQGAPARARTG